MLPIRRATAALLISATMLAATAALAVAPPSAAQRQAFMASPEDEPAKELLGIKGYEGRHYLAGDEWNGHLWKPSIENLGGGYVGVGADQAYLFIGWARPEFAWLIDYDILVVRLHGVHHAFFAEAADVDAFIALWADRKAGIALLDAKIADEAERKELRKIYTTARGQVTTRLRMLQRRLKKLKVASYLTDADTYTFVRESIVAGRVRRMSTNLLESKGMVGIGKAAEQMGVKIRLTYLSNAEQYWPYSDQFRTNLRSLPYDDKSLVIRTLSTFSINKDYRYVIQPGLTYQVFLERKWMKHVHRMIPRRKLEGPDDIELLVYTKTPEEIEARRAKHSARGKRGKRAKKSD